MKRLQLNWFLLLPLIFFVFKTQADDLGVDSWKVKYTKDEIVVYEPVQSKTKLTPLKVSTKVNHSVSRVIEVFANVERAPEWVPLMKTSKKINIGNQVIYQNLFDSPWPVTDREFLVKLDVSEDAEQGKVYVDVSSVNDSGVNVAQDHVRGVCYVGRIELTPVDNGSSTQITATYFIDPKGRIPHWLVNFVQSRWPHDYFSRLKNQLNKKDIVVQQAYKKFDLIGVKRDLSSK